GDEDGRSWLPRWTTILVISLAGLLLEVGYTRIISYKLWYYYTYLVIGLALLGIGSGGVLVAVVAPLRRWSTDRVVGLAATASAITIAAGYLLVSQVPIDTRAIWDYGTRSSFKNLVVLGVICFVLFVSFIGLGIMISVLLGRAGDDVGRLYFADLIGAGLASLVAIPLISRLGPPAVILLAALLFALVGLASLPRRSTPFVVGAIASVVLAVGVFGSGALPDVEVEADKLGGAQALFSGWGPVFRVDVHQVPGDDSDRLLGHDGTFGSGIHSFDGDVEGLLADYEADPRATPFDILGGPPGRELIIGSAGGNEILASLAFGATAIEAVELNPVTVGLLKGEFAEYTGNLAERPEVDLHQGDGRSYLARADTAYDLIWFVAPDSYAANNAASSGAFVLSESYLYTQEMIEESLRHLTDDGIVVVQFGELDVEAAPNRTSRYLVTARDALEAVGAADPTRHMVVAAYLTEATGDLSTIVLKRTPFTPAEVDRYLDGLTDLPQTVSFHAPGESPGDGIVSRVASGTPAQVDAVVAEYPGDITTVRDDSPFFWHFTPFGDVIGDFLEPIAVEDPESRIGERVLLLLLAVAVLFAAAFLLLPFVVIRRRWSDLPAKGVSAAYFAALGLGFMLFEITMIQRLTRFLGYPTYSLTVTLASILVFTGIGALLSHRVAAQGRRGAVVVLAALALLTAFYQFALDGLTDSLLDQGLAVRVVVALLLLAPLGLCLGMFMPLGLGLVARLGPDGEQYVAWSWAVNGFFSVIGSVLTTMLSMTIGFRAVQLLALAVYGLAVVALTRLHHVVGGLSVAAP
ncbi:MAG: hypothetical protein M3527_06580, partial [Actinomycetota bacterium]|nr:hypothetical protein [Actinomycetota bacterium]